MSVCLFHIYIYIFFFIVLFFFFFVYFSETVMFSLLVVTVTGQRSERVPDLFLDPKWSLRDSQFHPLLPPPPPQPPSEWDSCQSAGLAGRGEQSSWCENRQDSGLRDRAMSHGAMSHTLPVGYCCRLSLGLAYWG